MRIQFLFKLPMHLPALSTRISGNAFHMKTDAHPLEFADVLLHRQTIDGTRDAEESCQETGSEAQLQGKER